MKRASKSLDQIAQEMICVNWICRVVPQPSVNLESKRMAWVEEGRGCKGGI